MVVFTCSESEENEENFAEHCFQSYHYQTQYHGPGQSERSESVRLTVTSENRSQERCLTQLKKLLEKEIRYHPTLKTIQSSNNLGMVGSSDRDCAVTSLRCLHSFYGFSPETFANAVNYLDRFISKVRVRAKYLSCVAAGCYILSCKINEEAEVTPTATQLSYLHGGCWKPSDLKRMEGALLDKLKWDLSSVSCLSFLKVFCDILCLLQPDLRLADNLINRFEVCVNSFGCAQHRPSTLALCLLQSYIETSTSVTSLTSYYMVKIQDLCQVAESEMLECLSLVKNRLQDYQYHPGKLTPCLPLPKTLRKQHLKSKPSLYGDTDLPTIYEDHSESILGESSPFDSMAGLPLNSELCHLKINSYFVSRHIRVHQNSHIPVSYFMYFFIATLYAILTY